MSRLKILIAVASLGTATACNPIGTAVNVVTAPVDLAAGVVDAAI